MRCQNCNEADATVHLKEVSDGQLQELHLCESCATEKGLHLVVQHNKLTIATQFIWMAENLYPETAGRLGAVQCSSCGLRYSQFSRAGRVGCAECYDAFQPQLQKVLLRVHGATKHKGRLPEASAHGAGDREPGVTGGPGTALSGGDEGAPTTVDAGTGSGGPGGLDPGPAGPDPGTGGKGHSGSGGPGGPGGPGGTGGSGGPGEGALPPAEMSPKEIEGRVATLEAQLRQAVRTEAFEEAARLRDQIRHLQGGSE